jgi:DNA-binding beta-propeller fold protein YncE
MSTNTVIATQPLALSVSDLAVGPDGKHVYASRNGARVADVAVLDTTTDRVEVIDIADAGKAPGTTTECVRVNNDGSRGYVGINGPAGGQLVVIGLHAQSDQARAAGRARWRQKRSARSPGEQTNLRVIDTVAIGLHVRDVALSPNGAIAYVASCSPDVGAVVDVIDTQTNKITSTHKLGEIGILTGLTLSANGDRAYLVSDDRVRVLCTLTRDVIGTLAVRTQPSCVVESPDGRQLYIADYSGAITVTPVASTTPSAIESAAPDGDVPAARLMPEVVQYQPALT